MSHNYIKTLNSSDHTLSFRVCVVMTTNFTCRVTSSEGSGKTGDVAMVTVKEEEDKDVDDSSEDEPSKGVDGEGQRYI